MKCKKFFSAVLAGVLALSLAVPAMAAAADTENNTTGSQNYVVDAEVNNATIKVTVPKEMTDKIKLNPYQLSYTNAMGAEIKESIFSPAQYMTNLSDTAIGVTAAVKATKGGDVVLLANKAAYDSAVAESATSTTGLKNVYMYLEMVTVNDTMSSPTWATAYDAAKHLALVEATTSPTGQQKKNIATMEAAQNGMAAMEKGSVAFHFAGAVNDKTDDAWASEDKISLDITFTFTPLSTTTGVTPGADEAVPAAGGGGGGGGGGTPAVTGSVTPDDATLSLSGTDSTTVTASLSTGTVASVVWSIDTSDPATTGAATIGSGTGATETVTATSAGDVVVKAVITDGNGDDYTATTTITITA